MEETYGEQKYNEKDMRKLLHRHKAKFYEDSEEGATKSVGKEAQGRMDVWEDGHPCQKEQDVPWYKGIREGGNFQRCDCLSVPETL